jgi:hypothetical protein
MNVRPCGKKIGMYGRIMLKYFVKKCGMDRVSALLGPLSGSS